MRPSTEIAAFDGGMRIHRRGGSSRRDPDARFIRWCASARCIPVWSTHCVQLEVTQVYKRAKHDVGINSCLVKSWR